LNSTLATKACDYIVENIRNGKFAANEKISDRAISKELNISHLIVREALSKLTEQGWIVRIPQRGAYVRNIVERDLEDIYILREVIEITAVRLLSNRVTPDQLTELEGYVTELEKALRKGDSIRYDKADMEIHKAIVRFSGSDRLQSLFGSLFLQCEFTFSQVVSDTLDAMSALFGNNFDTMTTNHRQLYEAIAEKRFDDAEKVVRNHIRLSFHMIHTLQELRKVQ